MNEQAKCTCPRDKGWQNVISGAYVAIMMESCPVHGEDFREKRKRKREEALKRWKEEAGKTE